MGARRFAALVTLVAAVTVPAAAADPGPVGTICTGATVGLPCLDPLGGGATETVADAQRPDPTKNPVYDSLTGMWGGPFPAGDGMAHGGLPDPPLTGPGIPASPRTSIALGGGQIYVANSYWNAPQGMGVYAYDANSLTTSTHVARFPSEVADATGIAYYNGEVFVSVQVRSTDNSAAGGYWQGRILVYDTNLVLKRELFTDSPYLGGCAGIDVAWDEIWCRMVEDTAPGLKLNELQLTSPIGVLGPAYVDGAVLDGFEVFDAQTGALRSIVPLGLSAAVANGGSYDSFDKGAWNPKDASISPELGVVSSGKYSIHPDTGYAQTAPAASFVTGSGVGYSSAQAGPWVREAYPTPAPNYMRGISCSTTSRCWAVGAYGIVATSNGGATWTVQRESANSEYVNAVSCPTTLRCYVAAENDAISVGELLVTADGGQTWTTRTTGYTWGVKSISCPDATHCWATDGIHVLATSNGGQSWSTQYTDSNGLGGVVCASTSTCLVSLPHARLLRTADGGFSWSAQTISGGAGYGLS